MELIKWEYLSKQILSSLLLKLTYLCGRRQNWLVTKILIFDFWRNFKKLMHKNLKDCLMYKNCMILHQPSYRDDLLHDGLFMIMFFYSGFSLIYSIDSTVKIIFQTFRSWRNWVQIAICTRRSLKITLTLSIHLQVLLFFPIGYTKSLHCVCTYYQTTTTYTSWRTRKQARQKKNREKIRSAPRGVQSARGPEA